MLLHKIHTIASPLRKMLCNSNGLWIPSTQGRKAKFTGQFRKIWPQNKDSLEDGFPVKHISCTILNHIDLLGPLQHLSEGEGIGLPDLPGASCIVSCAMKNDLRDSSLLKPIQTSKDLTLHVNLQLQRVCCLIWIILPSLVVKSACRRVSQFRISNISFPANIVLWSYPETITNTYTSKFLDNLHVV